MPPDGGGDALDSQQSLDISPSIQPRPAAVLDWNILDEQEVVRPFAEIQALLERRLLVALPRRR